MDYHRLISFEIPEIRHGYTPRDAILYALSVGAGADPGNEAALDYVIDSRGPKVLPSYCVDLGHPGFWLSDPRTTVDATRLVHAEESFELLRPLEPEGDVTGRTRIVDVVDKGAGKGALLYLCKEVTESATGVPIARVYRTVLLRGDGGYDGPSGTPRTPHVMPATPPDFVRDIAVRPEQALLYRLNGDPNPLHVEHSVARAAGFARPILHGLCTFGMTFTAALLALAGGQASRVRGFGGRFTAPVYPGETLRVEIWKDGAVQATALEREARVLAHGRLELTAS